MTYKVAIIGAGLAGATYARALVEERNDIEVLIFERASKVGGNCADEVCPNTGHLIHSSGPHLYHDTNEENYNWLNRFANFVPYRHKVEALLEDGTRVPMPVSLKTVQHFHPMVRDLDEFVQANKFLDKHFGDDYGEPGTFKRWVISQFGDTIYQTLFEPYTRKMWSKDPSEMPAAVAKRLPLGSPEEVYFPNDKFQGLPTGGYSSMFQRMLFHPRIKVVEAEVSSQAIQLLAQFDHIVFTCALDAFFNFELGVLPSRGIKFALKRDGELPYFAQHAQVATTNYTTQALPFTRFTRLDLLPNSKGEGKLAMWETPFDPNKQDRYRMYPVHSADGKERKLYNSYLQLLTATLDGVVTFDLCGRLSQWQYMNMNDVVLVSRKKASSYASKLITM